MVNHNEYSIKFLQVNDLLHVLQVTLRPVTMGPVKLKT